MHHQHVHRVDAGSGSASICLDSGALAALSTSDTEFLAEPTGRRGLLRMAVPLEDYLSHYLEVGTHGAPEVHTDGGRLRLVYPELASDHHRLAVRTEITLTPAAQGLVLRARVTNDSDMVIPQVAFPQLLGLGAVGGPADTRLQLGRRRMLPFQELTMRVDDGWWLERALQEYIGYGGMQFNMKWLDYGDAGQGLTLYSRSPRYTAQGLVVDRVDRHREAIDIHWVHYPFIAPGETWDSDEYVLLVHPGDWYAGARAYQRFAAERYPYQAPRHIREALGIRSLWPAVRNGPLNFPIAELPRYAEEIADPDLGLAELVLWHWWRKNGLPILFDRRLGTEEQLVQALARCRELGVPVSMFVSHNILRQTDETDPDWMYRNAAGQSVGDNWTYGPGFLPKFQVSFVGSHAMVAASALSPGWRESSLADYRRILDYGAASICFDVFRTLPAPDFNPAGDGRPDEAGEKLLELAEQAREMIHERDPDGTFSGEFMADVKVPVLDYTWEWRSGYHMADAVAFRYVFPQVRLNANVIERRGAITAFMESALLNVIPGDMRSHRLADHPDLLAALRQLAALRRRFLAYFTDGQYRYTEGLHATGCQARLYTLGDRLLVIVTNPTDDPAEARVSVDPGAWGAPRATFDVTTYAIDGGVRASTTGQGPADVQTFSLQPDDLAVLEFVPAAAPAGDQG